MKQTGTVNTYTQLQTNKKKKILILTFSIAVWSEETQATVLLLIADIRLDDRVRDSGLHSVQGTFKVSGFDVPSFDVLLQGQEGSLSTYCSYLGQETDTVTVRQSTPSTEHY